MSSLATNDIVQEKRFLVRSSSLKEIRSFAREVFEKLSLNGDVKEEIVLAIAEAAQNIVKHAYKDFPETDDKMLLQIKCTNGKLEIGYMDEDSKEIIKPYHISIEEEDFEKMNEEDGGYIKPK